MMNGKVQEKKLCQTRKKKLLSFILNITLLNLTNNCEGRQNFLHCHFITTNQENHYFRDRLHRWGCERILAVGFMLQALRLQSRSERQPRLSASTLAKVTPYARKWWYLTQQRKKPRKESPKLQDNLTLNNAVKVGVASLLTQDRITHEVLLRIGLVNEGSQMTIQR